MSMVTSSDNGSYARKLVAAAERDLKDSNDYESDWDWRQLKAIQSIANSLLAIAVVIIDINEEEEMYGE